MTYSRDACATCLRNMTLSVMLFLRRLCSASFARHVTASNSATQACRHQLMHSECQCLPLAPNRRRHALPASRPPRRVCALVLNQRLLTHLRRAKNDVKRI